MQTCRDDGVPIEETLTALDHAVATGRASYVGISNYTGWQTAQAATWQRAVPGRTPLVSTQVEYSLLNRGIEHELHSEGGVTFFEALAPVPLDHVPDKERDLFLSEGGVTHVER